MALRSPAKLVRSQHGNRALAQWDQSLIRWDLKSLTGNTQPSLEPQDEDEEEEEEDEDEDDEYDDDEY